MVTTTTMNGSSSKKVLVRVATLSRIDLIIIISARSNDITDGPKSSARKIEVSRNNK